MLVSCVRWATVRSVHRSPGRRSEQDHAAVAGLPRALRAGQIQGSRDRRRMFREKLRDWYFSSLTAPARPLRTIWWATKRGRKAAGLERNLLNVVCAACTGHGGAGVWPTETSTPRRLEVRHGAIYGVGRTGSLRRACRTLPLGGRTNGRPRGGSFIAYACGSLQANVRAPQGLAQQ